MARSLVIVESPAKAKTINRYLGNDYIVRSSVGHIRDLPVGGKASDPKARAAEAAKTRKLPPAKREAYKKERARKQLVRRMGIDPDNDWEATYEILPGKEKVISELSKLAEKAEAIYLATDLDREGRGHRLAPAGGHRRVIEARYPAGWCSTRSPSESHPARPSTGPRELDYEPGQCPAGAALPRPGGRLRWCRHCCGPRSREACPPGRVQSVAVRLIVEREREIHAFMPGGILGESIAELANVRATRSRLRFQVRQVMPGPSSDPAMKRRPTRAVARAVGNSTFTGQIRREDKPTRSKPNAPFITSTLQQAASTRLGFSVKKTMTMAQRLYEAGYITYMRTDSTNLSAEAVAACREYIGEKHGGRYLPEKPNVYAAKKDAQEAHEAIRPSNVGTVSEFLSRGG